MAELGELVDALNASLTTWCRDESGDWRVVGSRGHIYAQPEGFYLYHDAGGKLAWTWAKRKLEFCKVTQDGDDEGFFLLDRLPTPAEAEIIRSQLGIRKRKVISETEMARLKQAAFRKKLPGESGEVRDAAKPEESEI